MSLIFATIILIGLIMAVMAVGIIFKRKPLRGSCGGSEIWDCDGNSLTCGACPNRKNKEESGEPAVTR